MTKIIRKGTRAVVINANEPEGPFWACLYVNCSGDQLGDITPIRAKRATLKGMTKWAEQELAK